MFSSESNFTTKNRHLTQCVDKNRPLKFKYSSLLRWSSSSISNYVPPWSFVWQGQKRTSSYKTSGERGFENFHLISGQNKGGVVVTLFAGKISLRFKMMTTNQRPKKNPKNDRKIGLQKPEIPLLTPIILKVNSASALL